eukprot:scaffold13641_cov42-Cyclotella_meneghiniana.AAC.9
MKLGAAAGHLVDHATQLFHATITAYLKQIDKNRAHKAVNKEASKFLKESSERVIVYSRKFLENELNSTKCELENVKRNLQAEKSKRRKLEHQMSKEKRGLTEGSSQTNADQVINLASPDRLQHSPPPTYPPSTINTAVANQNLSSPSHERQRGGPRSDGPQGRAPGRGRGSGRVQGRGGRGNLPHSQNPNRRVRINDEANDQTREQDEQHWSKKGGG